MNLFSDHPVPTEKKVTQVLDNLGYVVDRFTLGKVKIIDPLDNAVRGEGSTLVKAFLNIKGGLY